VTARRTVPLGRAPEIVRVAPCDWRKACLHAHENRKRFRGLFADSLGHGSVELRAVFEAAGEESVIVSGRREATFEASPPVFETIVDAIPAAGWDEREANDLHHVRFAGHQPLRPLLDHQAPLDVWTVPTIGHDTHQVAVGPIHAGVIESGHFRFQVVGERILHLDVRLFYKRRALEAAAAGRPLTEGIAYAQRACAACAVTNTVAYAQACEAALGLEPDRELRRTRTVLLELERVYNHLHDISMICAGVGFAAGTMAYAALKERAQRLNERLTGHRFLFDTVAVAASDLFLSEHQVGHARRELQAIGDEHTTSWRELQFVSSLQQRLAGPGVLSTEDAARLGAVGPVARASGVREDTRADSPRLCYGDFHLAMQHPATGDVARRTAQRSIEIEQSLGLLDELFDRPLLPGRAQPAGDGSRIGIGRVESPRGTTVCLLERDDQRVRALHLRTGSYANWPVLAHVVAGELMPDFPLINKSFELCYACVDR
jgi:Ni,Fe-hydrogenase III large subunit